MFLVIHLRHDKHNMTTSINTDITYTYNGICKIMDIVKLDYNRMPTNANL
jgi:hypothetical protein